jgi:hypothetical protein
MFRPSRRPSKPEPVILRILPPPEPPVLAGRWFAEPDEHWPSVSLILSLARGERWRAVRAIRSRKKDPYLDAVRALELAFRWEPIVLPGGCGRCGADIAIHPYPVRSGKGVAAKSFNLCAVCCFDRVRRWRDLYGALNAKGQEFRVSSGFR